MRYLIAILLLATTAQAQLPTQDGQFCFQGQSWPIQPGYRPVCGTAYFPGGRLANVNADTGICLTLHNWGGVGWEGTAHPVYLANYLNCVAVTIDYLQTGQAAFGPAPYDHGLYQAVDAIRGLWYVFYSLQGQGKVFDKRRIYGIGGSGGGDVILMAHRLAPRTFAAVLAISPPVTPKFSGPLDTRWGALPPNEFRIRDLTDAPMGNITRSLSFAYVKIIHGRNDWIAPWADASRAASALGGDLLTVEPWGLWGPYQDALHTIGDRTNIALHFLQMPMWSFRRPTYTDFEVGDNLVRYPVEGGKWGMSYNGIPTLLWLP